MPAPALHPPRAPGACGRWLRAGGYAALLAAAPAMGQEPAAARPAAMAGVPGETVAIPALDPRLRELHDQSRADTLGAARQLQAWAQGLPATDARRVQALALAGALLAARADTAGAEAMLNQLGELAPQAALAAPAAALVQAALDARRGALPRAASRLREAVERLGPDGPPLLRLEAMWALARAAEATGQFNDALPLRYRLLALADALGSPRLRSESRSSLANTLLMADRSDAAAEINAQAMAIARSADDPLAQSRAWTIEATLRNAAGDAAGERHAMLEAIAQARRAGAHDDIVLGLANLSDHYLLRRDFATALQHARQALPIARDNGDIDSESVALLNIGLALVSLHRLDEGLAAVDQGRALLLRIGDERRLANLEEELGGYLERAGHARQALEAYRRHRSLAEALAQRRQDEALLEMQERFDGSRRQEELASLQQENRLREAVLRNQALQQRVWAAGALVGVLILVLMAALLRRLRRQQQRLAERNERLRHEGERDPLTGLANRHHVIGRCAGAQDGGFAGGLLIVDLDHFKRINDTLGHAAGDATLVEVARRLRDAVRDDDLVARWGGEEFLVVTAPTTTAALQTLVQRVLDRLAGAPVDLPQGAWRISASIGFAAFPLAPGAPACSWDAAVDRVDRALYLAKSQGRNRACGIEGIEGHGEALRDIADLQAGVRAGHLRLRTLEGPAVTNGPLAEAAA